MLCFCSQIYCCYHKTDKLKFSGKGLNKGVLENSGDGTMSKNRRVRDESINQTPTNGGFRTVNQMVAACEQTNKGLSYLNRKRQV